jgi:Na+-transporting NADH:ubiquinone oxidoreductase subunit NqrB
MGMNGLNCSRDPRHYQTGVLALLVVYGVVALDFGIHWYNAAGIVITTMAVQFVAGRLTGLAAFDLRSPLITALSLTLLLRTDDIRLAMAAAAIAIGSKFLIRVNGKHVFNPANIAIVSLVLATDDAWVSTGQWGSTAISALALACLGFIVLTRAKRAETTIGFLLFYSTLLIGRAIWLDDPLSIPLHYMQNGALLIFSFFMISDPKTSPNTALGRVIFAGIVATIAVVIQFMLYQPNGAIFALIISAPLVPLIDYLLRGQIYQWHLPHTDKKLVPLRIRIDSKE